MEYRGYKIEGDGTYGYKVIKSLKGALPMSLRGLFTSTPQAQRAIDLQLIDKKD